jgi:hypothetical protein
MLLLLTMNSTVRHYRTANVLLFELLKHKKMSDILTLDKDFNLPSKRSEEEELYSK